MYRKLTNGLLLLLSTVCLYGVGAQVRFTRLPKNTAALAGTSVMLECEFNISESQVSDVEWQLLGLGLNPVHISLNGAIRNSSEIRDRGFTSKYSIDANEAGDLRAVDLHVNRTNTTDNLYHQCRWINDNVFHAALVLILEDRAACGLSARGLFYGNEEITMEEFETLNLTCHVPYTSKWSDQGAEWPPLVSWSGLSVGDEREETKDAGDGLASSQLITGPLAASYNGDTIVCKVNFTDSPPGAIAPGVNIDTRIPEYEDFCNISLNVLFSARDITLDRDLETAPVTVNDTIVCSADGNPHPEVTWLKVAGEGDADIDGAVLVITESMAGETHTYNCTAENIIRSNRHKISRSYTFAVDALFIETTTVQIDTTEVLTTTPASTSSEPRTTSSSLQTDPPTTSTTSTTSTTPTTPTTSIPSTTSTTPTTSTTVTTSTKTQSTARSQSQTTSTATLSVTQPQSVSDAATGLPTWGLVVIVIVVLLIIVIALAAFIFHHHRQQKKKGKAKITKKNAEQQPQTQTELEPCATTENITDKIDNEYGGQEPASLDDKDASLANEPRANGHVMHSDSNPTETTGENTNRYTSDQTVTIHDVGEEEPPQDHINQDNQSDHSDTEEDASSPEEDGEGEVKDEEGKEDPDSTSTTDVVLDMTEPTD